VFTQSRLYQKTGLHDAGSSGEVEVELLTSLLMFYSTSERGSHRRRRNSAAGQGGMTELTLSRMVQHQVLF